MMIYLIEVFKVFERYVPEIAKFFELFFESDASPNRLCEIFVFFLLQIIKLYSSSEKIKSKIAKNKFSQTSHIWSKYDFREYDSTYERTNQRRFRRKT